MIKYSTISIVIVTTFLIGCDVSKDQSAATDKFLRWLSSPQVVSWISTGKSNQLWAELDGYRLGLLYLGPNNHAVRGFEYCGGMMIKNGADGSNEFWDYNIGKNGKILTLNAHVVIDSQGNLTICKDSPVDVNAVTEENRKAIKDMLMNVMQSKPWLEPD